MNTFKNYLAQVNNLEKKIQQAPDFEKPILKQELENLKWYYALCISTT